MTRLEMRALPAAFAAALAVGCVSPTDGATGDDEEVGTSESELKARPTSDPSLTIGNLRASDDGQAITASFALPSWRESAHPMGRACGWTAQRFTIKADVERASKRGIRVKNIKLSYDTEIAPAALFVFDSSGTPTFSFGADAFVRAGNLGRRGPGSSDKIRVNATFRPQSNGEGVNIELRLFDDTASSDATCGRSVILALKVAR